MSTSDKPEKPANGIEKDDRSARASMATGETSREQKLAKQLRDNLARRKSQSKARNIKPRKFRKSGD